MTTRGVAVQAHGVAVRASEVTVRYGKKTAVEGVSFTVDDRDIVGIIGPNGCGKSSLMAAVAGRLKPQAGSVSVAGRRIQSLTSRRRAQLIGLLNQRNTAPEDITVRDLVSYGRHPYRRWHERFSDDDQATVDWALEHTQLVAFAERPLAQLSGGEAQRAWIAMALAQRPQVLLLDEPTTYLDIAHQHEVLEIVAGLGRTLGITVIMVLHDLNQAAMFTSGILAMSGGRLVADGTPLEVLTVDLVRTVYGMEAEITQPAPGAPPRIHLTRTRSF